jgi:hypothetical protein
VTGKDMGAWTPGPWEVLWGQSRNEDRVLVSSVDGIEVAEVFYTLEQRGRHTGNARLIAAAPALFEALESIVVEKADYMRLNHLGDPEAQHTVKQARSALALARGESIK